MVDKRTRGKRNKLRDVSMVSFADFAVEMLFTVFLDLAAIPYQNRRIPAEPRAFYRERLIRYSQQFRAFQIVYGVFVKHLLVECATDGMIVRLNTFEPIPYPTDDLLRRSGKGGKIFPVVFTHALRQEFRHTVYGGISDVFQNSFVAREIVIVPKQLGSQAARTRT